MNLRMPNMRRLSAVLLVALFAYAEVAVSVPQLHAHSMAGAISTESVSAGSGAPLDHGHGPASSHECLSCRVLVRHIALTLAAGIAAPFEQAFAVPAETFVATSSEARTSIRDRAPPSA